MLSDGSPFLNIPSGLDAKQAVFLDGMRHAVEIADLSYTRLCRELTKLAFKESEGSRSSKFTHIFLDAWAFIDAVDRFRCLWEMQPSSELICKEFSPGSVRSRLQMIRDVRNVSAHIAQKVDQIVALNSSALGSINWVTFISHEPLKVKTYFIRPGVVGGRLKERFAMPNGVVDFIHGSGCVSLTIGKHVVNLSEAYKIVCSIVGFAEASMTFITQGSEHIQHLPGDVFGSAELDMGGM